MKIKLNIIIILLIAICLSAIQPIVYFYRDKNIKEIPKHISYNMAIDSLTIQLQQKAKKNNCNGFIIPINEVKNNTPFISSLRADINLVLASYENWNLKVDKTIQREMKKRFEENMDKWGSLLTGNELLKMLKQQHKSLPKYFAKLKIEKIDNPEIANDRKIYIYIYSERTGAEIINVSSNFIHPVTLAKLKNFKKGEEDKLSKFKKSVDLSFKIMIGFSIILIGYLLTFVIIFIYNKIKDRKNKNILLQEIQKRENLFDNGHFVAVLELTDKYLSAFPDDIEIKAFRERVLDFTNNDPKKAQQAYVKAQKLKLFIKNYKTNPNSVLLDSNERKEISSLVPYNPELKSSYTKLIAYEKEENKHEEFLSGYNEIKRLIGEKYLKKAMEQTINLQREYPNNSDIISLKTEIENKQIEVKEKNQNIKESLKKGNIVNLYKQLNAIKKIQKDSPEINEMNNNLEKNKNENHFVFVPENIGDKSIEIFFTNEIMLGREDVGVEPDIKFQDRKISRSHLKIKMSEDKLIAEDLKSTGGSFVNGEKILQRSLNDNDKLNLAKIIDLKLFTQKVDGNVSGFILTGHEKNHIIILSKLDFGFENKKITNEKNDFSLIQQNGIKILTTKSKGIILNKGLKISLGNKNYKLEI